MKFIAVQTGARRGYAVPAILEQAGMLERFYTDMAGNVGLGGKLSTLRRLPILGPKFARLSSREVPPEIAGKTRTFGCTHMGGMWRDVAGSADAAHRFVRQLKASQRWGEAMIRAGFGEATHVFTMLSEGGPYVAEAHRRGLKIVAEIYILLATEKIMRAEQRAFPDWEPEMPDYANLRRQYTEDDVLWQYTHFYICPSEAVQDDLVANWNVARDRTALVPYGVNPRWLDLEPKPQRGRILFVGTAELRKGIHYLAMAAEKLKNQGRQYEFRVAGNVTEQVRRQPVCRHLNFLGRVPRDRVHEEFQQADVFVLPSLAEGSAEVTYEAMAAAVPLVVTRATGSVARDDIEGRIVPERDPVELASAIEQIVEDRATRDRLAHAARARARDFTWERYGERLITTLRVLPQ